MIIVDIISKNGCIQTLVLMETGTMYHLKKKDSGYLHAKRSLILKFCCTLGFVSIFFIIMTLIAMKDIYVPKNWYIYRWCIYLLGDCMELLLNHIKYYCFTTNFMYYWKFSYPVGHLVFESFIFKLSTRIILLVKRLCSDLVIYMLLITLVGVEKEGS
jgi:hypothetical protein